MTEARPDYPKITLGVIAIGGLILTSLWILRPFLGATIWAAMVVVATWPVLLWMQARLWNRRSLAVTAMVITLVLLFVLPLTLAISTIAENGDAIVEGSKSLISRGPPQLPEWIATLPLVGPKIATAWNELVASGVAGLQAKLMPYAKSATGWLPRRNIEP